MAARVKLYDLVIVGGGLVGWLLAKALAGTPLKIALIEAKSPEVQVDGGLDQRCLALSFGTHQYLQQLDIWSAIAEHASVIEHIHVSDQGHFGMQRLSAQKQGLPFLGQVMPICYLQDALMQLLPNLTVYQPAQVTALEQGKDRVRLQLDQDGEQKALTAKCVVAADGANSPIRGWLSIEATEKDYEQMAVVGNLALARAHGHTAYERFTPEGPIAVLPQPGLQAALIWCLSPEQAKAKLALPDDEFLKAIQHAFGYRVGRFIKKGRFGMYPLKLTESQQLTKDRVVLFGNAAHSLHPVAGQGFNLSVRDVKAFAALLIEANEQQQDIGSEALLSRYVDLRLKDQRRTTRITDLLVEGFGHKALPIAGVRGAVQHVMGRVPAAQRAFARMMMGRVK